MMLEAFAYKQYKKHKLAKELREANAKEALSKQDEEFIRQSIDNNKATKNTSMFKFLQKRKSSNNTVAPTVDELAAIKGEDDGIQRR
jgi:phage shock protein A